MRRVLCALFGHRPEARAVAGRWSVMTWARCRRCGVVLGPVERTPRANRAARRSGRTSSVRGRQL